MKLRILQAQDENDEWYDDAYAYEDSHGQVIFCYNLTWERMGSNCNAKLRERGTLLEEVETVIETGDRLRWLPIEVIAEEEVESYLEVLNERCAIPKPRSIAHLLDHTLVA